MNANTLRTRSACPPPGAADPLLLSLNRKTQRQRRHFRGAAKKRQPQIVPRVRRQIANPSGEKGIREMNGDDECSD